LIKNSYPFGKKCQKTAGRRDFFDSHCIVYDVIVVTEIGKIAKNNEKELH